MMIVPNLQKVIIKEIQGELDEFLPLAKPGEVVKVNLISDLLKKIILYYRLR